MKTEDWRILDTIYKTNNLTEASKELFLSQPALSKRLKIIEKKAAFKIITVIIKVSPSLRRVNILRKMQA